MTPKLLIDAHEDLAYESLFGKFDYTRSVADNRKYYQGPETFQCMTGWPELQEAGACVVFGTVFLIPPSSPIKTQINGETTYQTPDDFHKAVNAQLDFYDRLQEEHPDLFRRIFSRADFDQIMARWEKDPAGGNPIGLVGLLEGAEGLRSLDDLELYYERGIRLVGPVWGGGRWCSGTKSNEMKDALTQEGRTLLRKMASVGMILDISHMRNHSAMDALNAYDGIVVASHANCNALLNGLRPVRHFNDETIRMLIEHDGVMGVIPYNSFLNTDWKEDGFVPRETVTMETLANHIDHICQLAGNSRCAAIGTDADGGFGYPDIPYEMNDISDLPKLENVLRARGFSEEDVANIFYKNWQRILERALK